MSNQQYDTASVRCGGCLVTEAYLCGVNNMAEIIR